MSASSTPDRMPFAAKARVLIVDDHPLTRGGLIRLLEREPDLTCCGEAGSVTEGLLAVEQLKPDLVILDLMLKGGDGLQLAKCLRAQFPALRILMLSEYETPLFIERALRMGARGYVVKDQATDELLTAIRTVLAGKVYLTRPIASRLLHSFLGASSKAARSGISQLTDRELQVLQLLGVGKSTREISVELKLSFKTVETHRENIKHKLQLQGAAELVYYATQWVRSRCWHPARRSIRFSRNGPCPTA